MSTLYWSKRSDPEAWPSINTVGIGGLTVRLVPDAFIAEFSMAGHSCRIIMEQIVGNGSEWANRKLYRFRRYARKMNRNLSK